MSGKLVRHNPNFSPGITTIQVAIPGRTYPIVMGSGARARLASLLEARCVVVADDRVATLHLPALREALPSADLIEVPAGEGSKSWTQVGRLYEQLARLRVTRNDALVAFGGGMIGDLTGFVAGTWMRGIRHVIVPTTLEAAVDAAVGGKTGINIAAGKNLVGVFHQPAAVVVDTDFLRTLPERDFRAGLAESVKHAVITDSAFFDWHEREREALTQRDVAAITHLIERNCRIKADVVAADEREAGLRAILNYGHTVGHALEQSLQFALRHGECVALGIVAENVIAADRGLLDSSAALRIAALLAALGLPNRVDAPVSLDQVLASCRLDKKNRGADVCCMLATGIGSAPQPQTVIEAELRRALAAVGVTA